MNNYKSRFAKAEDIFSEDFEKINSKLLELNKEYDLTDHGDLNRDRFNWADQIKASPAFYGARMWEFPFALLAADLKPEMTCADIGCGTTPFTIYLADKVGSKNVTGFDPDYIPGKERDRHSAFGITQEHIDTIGINFRPDSLMQMNVPDESFDRVFCISVLEHINDNEVQRQGIQEMVRVLKPGGRLILTVDLGLKNPLTCPMDLIKFSGLVPLSEVDFRWPEKRFARYSGGMDVFGLILEKSTEKIYSDYECTKKIDQHQAYKKAVEVASYFSVDSEEAQIAHDIRRKNGKLKVIAKLLFGKY